MGLYHSPQIVTNGLVLCLDAANTKSYPGSGTSWRDLSSSQLTGTLSNVTAGSSSMSFNGTNSYVDIPSTSAIAITGDITISAWINVTNFTGAYRSICGKTVSNNPASYDYWLEANTGKPNLLRGNGGAGTPVFGTGAPATGTWQYIAVTMAGTAVTHYLNSSTNGTGTLSTTTGDSGTNLRVGSRTGNDIFFLGSIANINIYNRALSQVEVLQNYNAIRGRFGI